MLLRHEAVAPAAQGFGVIGAKVQLVHHLQACRLRLFAELAGAGQTTAGKNVLLNEVGRLQVTLEQTVVNGDALNARTATRLEQAADGLKVSRPIRLAHSLDHLNRAHRVKRCLAIGGGNVAVVLQAQVGTRGHAQCLHARVGKCQLLGRQGDARDVCTKFGGGRLGQCAPTTTDLQHTVARLGVHHAQGAAHFGLLRIGHGLGQITLKPSR